MSITLVNKNGHMLRNPNSNSWNEEGRFKDKPVQPWTFASTTSKALERAMNKLIEAGHKKEELKVEIVQIGPAKSKEKKAKEDSEELEDLPEEPEEDPEILFKKGLNEMCLKCVNKDKCAQPSCVEIMQCPQYKKA